MTKRMLELIIRSFWDRFDILLERFTEIIKIAFLVGSNQFFPGHVRLEICDACHVDCTVLFTLANLVSFFLAVATDLSRFIWTLGGWVSLLLADTTGTGEHSRIRAVGFRVSAYL